jgi:two-component system sensor histidine kinase KdpD
VRTFVAWAIAIAGCGAVTLIGRAAHINSNTAGFAFLIVVLFSSLRGGLVVGAVASIIATLCYNFFYFAPLHTFSIAEPANWIALGAFLVTSVIVSRLVIEARTAAERAEQRTSLLRVISHDLTTPLTAITLHTEALRRKAETDGDLKGPVAGIAGETLRLKRRIENLLSMARLEAGKAKPHAEPTPPADLFHAVRENLPLVFDSRPTSVIVDDDCPDVYVDPSLALEILVNLIENAHRMSPPSESVDMRAHRHPSDPQRVRLEVLDRGPGLPADSDSAQRGLGLEIARSLAAINGGAVAIVPRDGGGSIARVDLPAALLPMGQPS